MECIPSATASHWRAGNRFASLESYFGKKITGRMFRVRVPVRDSEGLAIVLLEERERSR